MTGPPVVGVATAVLTAAILSAVLAEGCRRVALRYGVIDNPGAHKGHPRPTPYLGGIAMVVATLGPAVALAAFTGGPAAMVLVAVAGLSVAAIGLADDVLPLGFRSRLAVEAVAATLVALGGARLAVFGHAWLDAGLTVAWIVLLTNSFNLLDNMDAAAASMAGVTAAVVGVAALAGGAGGSAVLLLCLAGSCAGFLVHNRPPARIFMGDAGSLFIGFVIAVGTVAYAPGGPVPALSVLLAVGFAALVDTGLVVVSRRRAGRSWRTGGTDHVSHRLRRLGLSTGQVVAVLAGAVALSGLVGVLVRHGPLHPGYALAATVAAGVAAVLLLIRVPGYPGDPVRADQASAKSLLS
jgi:UDP-GlcNAc:undecaprenyl-phosphate GlcNAc-1-phosphate transferase